jgi:hypothetical protein
MERRQIQGNRWALVGAVLYLLEWAAILPAGSTGPADPGSSQQEVLALYQDHRSLVMFMVTWCSVVLLGRLLIMTGVRAALRPLDASAPLLDLAVAAMAVSVALELIMLALVGAAEAVAAHGGSADTVVTLDTAGGVAGLMLWGPLGLSLLAASWAMLTSRAFPTWIPAVGIAGGVLLSVGSVLGGPGYLHSGALRTLNGVGMGGTTLFWVWMLATGIYLWRRTPSSPRPKVSAAA